jgi:hypothetical protein
VFFVKEKIFWLFFLFSFVLFIPRRHTPARRSCRYPPQQRERILFCCQKKFFVLSFFHADIHLRGALAVTLRSNESVFCFVVKKNFCFVFFYSTQTYTCAALLPLPSAATRAYFVFAKNLFYFTPHRHTPVRRSCRYPPQQRER